MNNGLNPNHFLDTNALNHLTAEGLVEGFHVAEAENSGHVAQQGEQTIAQAIVEIDNSVSSGFVSKALDIGGTAPDELQDRDGWWESPTTSKRTKCRLQAMIGRLKCISIDNRKQQSGNASKPKSIKCNQS